jgi:hypothetical protein
VDFEEMETWRSPIFQATIAGYEPREEYNIHKFGQFCDFLPNKLLVLWAQSAIVHITAAGQQRVAVLLGANVDVCDKMLLFVVGNVQKQRCFKQMKSLPKLEL